MVSLNYEEVLEKAERNLKEGSYVDVGIICGSIFETILKDFFFQIKDKADEKSLKQIEAAENKLNKKKIKGTKKFTIGEMLKLYEKAKLLDIAEKQLKKKLKIIKSTDLSWLTIIRNRCSH